MKSQFEVCGAPIKIVGCPGGGVTVDTCFHPLIFQPTLANADLNEAIMKYILTYEAQKGALRGPVSSVELLSRK